jgi:hypothetical protein
MPTIRYHSVKKIFNFKAYNYPKALTKSDVVLTSGATEQSIQLPFSEQLALLILNLDSPQGIIR